MAQGDGKGLFYCTDSFNNHLLHIACKNGNSDALKVSLSLSMFSYHTQLYPSICSLQLCMYAGYSKTLRCF